MRIYILCCDIITQKLYKDMEVFEKLSVLFLVLFGTIHTLKEAVLALISILSNTTYAERQSQLMKIYFKTSTHGVLESPFDKGIFMNIKEAVYIFLGLKTIGDPNDQLPSFSIPGTGHDDEAGSFNFKEKEEFFNQLNPDISEGIFDYHREFIYTTMEIECEARSFGIKMVKKKRRQGTSMSDSESLSSDSDDHFNEHNHGHSHGHDCDGDHDHGHNHGSSNSHREPQS